MGPPVQAAGAAQLQPRRGERQVMRGRRHWKRKQTPALPPRPPRRRAAIHRGLPPRLPYGVSGDTGKAGVGETEESLPLLAGKKVLPLIPSGSGGYAGATVWNWHRESSEGPGWPMAGGRGDRRPGPVHSPTARGHGELLGDTEEGVPVARPPATAQSRGAGQRRRQITPPDPVASSQAAGAERRPEDWSKSPSLSSSRLQSPCPTTTKTPRVGKGSSPRAPTRLLHPGHTWELCGPHVHADPPSSCFPPRPTAPGKHPGATLGPRRAQATGAEHLGSPARTPAFWGGAPSTGRSGVAMGPRPGWHVPPWCLLQRGREPGWQPVLRQGPFPIRT